jgi:para-aminobenzoate synthetase/4-amino-4-deoxychorismate lyase
MMDFLRQPGSVVCRSPGAGKRWLAFADPVAILTARTPADIIPLLATIEQHLAAGRWVAGALAYEAAAAFDPAHQVHPPDATTPLAWFGVYARPQSFPPPPPGRCVRPAAFTPAIRRKDYLDAVARVKTYIREGDIYQANLTFPALSSPIPDPASLFLTLLRDHPVPAAAWIHADGWQLASLSPEVFLSQKNGEIRSLPMKGTARRERSAADDSRAARALAHDPKNRAENVMITDMVRNDLGRVCVPGSICVDPLCRVDTYATVHQMISDVRGRVRPGVSLPNLLAATFPPASITGAPKIRAMQVIHELEPFPRRFYTGTIGVFAPNGDLFLNVAIRTLLCLPDRAELGIGSGIVADSDARAEWGECRLKSRFVRHRLPEFDILETLLWTRDGGFVLLPEHLRRARRSQHHFGRPWRICEIRRSLAELEDSLVRDGHRLARVRLLVDRVGNPRVEAQPLQKAGWGRDRLKICMAVRPVRSADAFLLHKTTHRRRYDKEFHAALAAGFDEILFRNERNEVTEGAISNLFARLDGQWFTPPLRCGLLPGIWRAAMIRELRAQERVLMPADLDRADAVVFGNSVRGPAPMGTLEP